jgi:hypothetical protein
MSREPGSLQASLNKRGIIQHSKCVRPAVSQSWLGIALDANTRQACGRYDNPLRFLLCGWRQLPSSCGRRATRRAQDHGTTIVYCTGSVVPYHGDGGNGPCDW